MSLARFIARDPYTPAATEEELEDVLAKIHGVSDWTVHSDGEVTLEYDRSIISSELLTLQHLCNNFTYVATIDRPQDESVQWTGHTGFVQDLWVNGVIADDWGFQPTPQNTDVFLCGNPAMIEDTLELLSKEGFREHSPRQSGEVHIERF